VYWWAVNRFGGFESGKWHRLVTGRSVRGRQWHRFMCWWAVACVGRFGGFESGKWHRLVTGRRRWLLSLVCVLAGSGITLVTGRSV